MRASLSNALPFFGVTDPTWASANLGVYLCLNCSGVHRSLGTHITQVRSITMDAWFPDQIEVRHVQATRHSAAPLRPSPDSLPCAPLTRPEPTSELHTLPTLYLPPLHRR